MGWLILFLLAAVTGLALWRFARLSGPTLQLMASALLLGIAGYAWQGNPSLAGHPAAPNADVMLPDTAFATERAKLMGRFGNEAQWLDFADALHRAGLDQEAVIAIKSGLAKFPNSADLWVGLGNALVTHGGGMMSPSAQFAFDRAAQIAPDHPGPPFFMGLAYAQAGQIDKAEAVWRALLAKTPPDAPWRADLEQRLSVIAQARARMGQ
jgi:cytochrome c-type biogenesis protein CcmH/NrfG